MAQVCLPTAEDFAAFTDDMKSAANSYNMKFIDGSAMTQRDLEDIGTPQIKAEIAKNPVVNMGVVRADGIGMTFGNLGLPPHQYAFGFSEGSDPDYANKFANDFVGKVSQRWHIEMVPNGEGARGMKQCQ
jgi:hypothetical protein